MNNKENTRWSNEQEFKFGTVEQPERRILTVDELPRLSLSDDSSLNCETLPQLGMMEGENDI